MFHAFAASVETLRRLIRDTNPAQRSRLFIDDIDSFSKVRAIDREMVTDLLDENGFLNVAEDVIQTLLEEILGVPNHKKDWGGEENDLYTGNLSFHGKRRPSAFALKGRGTKKNYLEISDCGKNGDQLVRLFQSPAEIFVVQFVGAISESVIKDVESKTENARHRNPAWCCFIDGQDTARLLRAYEKL